MVQLANSWNQEELNLIRSQLQRIVESEYFSSAIRLSRFLSFIVEETLAGNADRLGQYQIGLEIFDRDESFDPTTDALVRVEAGRLRAKLAEYYADTGNSDPLRITLPKGGYGVVIAFVETSPSDSESSQVPTTKRYRPGLILFVGFLISGACAWIFISLTDLWQDGSAVSAPVTSPRLRDDANPSIAVLPFDNMSEDASQEYFSDGIAEDIITDLSKASGLTVIARHSSFRFKGKPISIREINRELGVDFVLEGSVRKTGDRVRITAQLIDARSESHLWAERYDRELTDIFDVQDNVSEMIVKALNIELSELESRRLERHSTDSIEAHDRILRARDLFYGFSGDGIKQAAVLVDQAIDLDPGYAEAYAWKSRILVIKFVTGLNQSLDETINPAISMAHRAIELDPDLPMGHANLAWALRWNRDYDAAISHVKAALELDKDFADAFLWQSLILSATGNGDGGLDSIKRGIQYNPYHAVTYTFAQGRAYFELGDYENALIHFNRGIERRRPFLPNHVYKVFTLRLDGRESEARAAERVLESINPDFRNSASYTYFALEHENRE